MTDLDAITLTLKKHYSPQTYGHCRRTADTAAMLASRCGCDVEQARIAGLLHDYAKEMDGPSLIRDAKAFGIPLSTVDVQNPYLLHGPVGACLVRRDLRLDEEWLMDAIGKHTYGASAMSALDKVIYLADVIEPGRGFVGLESIREEANVSIDTAFAMAYEGQLMFVLSQRKPLHPVSVEVWNGLVVA